MRVAEITALIKETLEQSFRGVAIEGEISNFRPASSGHLYFTLKDAESMIQAVMFRSRAERLAFTPEDGQLVIARGNISVYPRRGNYQIICDSLELAGEGAILALLEKRKRALAAEGLFDASRKRTLPMLPAKVAVVTSPTGAAIRDILRVIGRRSAGVDVVILPTAVQGDLAADAIARQIRIANIHRLGEVIIVGRGGGSLEDLLPFSEETVVRAVAESDLPIISAVGHEIDIALSDLAADVRAPTPSAAAELVSAQREALIDRVQTCTYRLERTLVGRIERSRMLLDQFRPEHLERSFRALIQPSLLRLDDAKEALLRSLSERVSRLSHRLELGTQRLESVSPAAILKKGYAVVTEIDTRRVVTDAATQRSGNELSIRLARGTLEATIQEVHDEKL